MNLDDLEIGGIKVSVLRAQKAAIQKDAAKVISENIEAGKMLVEQMLKSEDRSEILTLAQQATEHFEIAQIVYGVSGVMFYLDYDSEYGDESPLSYKIAAAYYDGDEERASLFEFGYRNRNELYQLHNLLESMESDSRGWHSSSCY